MSIHDDDGGREGGKPTESEFNQRIIRPILMAIHSTFSSLHEPAWFVIETINTLKGPGKGVSS